MCSSDLGAENVRISGKSFSVGSVTVKEGDWLSLDGTTGEIMVGQLKLAGSKPPKEFDIILKWSDDVRKGKLDVRANADTEEDARKARELGAQGIGLCRTEHMFLAPDRLPVVRRMILASTPAEEHKALEELRKVQPDKLALAVGIMSDQAAKLAGIAEHDKDKRPGLSIEDAAALIEAARQRVASKVSKIGRAHV